MGTVMFFLQEQIGTVWHDQYRPAQVSVQGNACQPLLWTSCHGELWPLLAPHN